MTRRRPDERNGNTRKTARCLGAALMGLVAMSANAQGLSGRVILSDQNYSTDDLSSRLFDQLYEMRFARSVSDRISYLLFFRGEESDGHSKVGTESSSARFLQLEPHAEATYTLPTIQLLGRYDLIATSSKIDGGAEDRRRLENLFGSFSFRPDDLPGAHVSVQQTAVHDARASIDQTQTYVQGGLDYRWGNLFASARVLRSDFEDPVNGLSRKTDGVEGDIAYQDTLLSGRLTLLLNAQVTLDREVDRTRTALVSAETVVPVVKAFSSIDDTPDDSRDNPAIPMPGLIDGNLTAGTIVSVGPDGVSFQNIVVDLGRFTRLDMFHIYVRDASGHLVPRGGSVDFTVYTSQDAIRWTPVRGAVTTFVTVFSRYDVTFPATTSRYFKVVSFDLAPTDALVTEIQAIVHKRFGENVTQTTDIRFATENATLSYHPFSGMTLLYSGLFNQSRDTPDFQQETSTTESDQLVYASWDATRRLNFLAQYQWRDVRSPGDFSQSYRALTANLRYAALRSIDLMLQGITTSQEDSGVRSETQTASFLTYVRFLRTLDLSANVGLQKQKFLDTGQTTDQWFVTGHSTADLTVNLHLRLDASYTRNRSKGAAAIVLPVDEERYTGDLFYRPGPQLGLDIRIGWVKSGNLSSPTQNYLVDWRPFTYGSLRLGGRYEVDIEPFTNRRAQRLILDPSWTLNRHTTINLNYTRQTVTGSPRTNIFFTSLTVTM